VLSPLAQVCLLLYAPLQAVLGSWPPLQLELNSSVGDITKLGAFPPDGLGPDDYPLPFPLSVNTSLDQGPLTQSGGFAWAKGD
jgi:hypothetical protein